MERKRLSSFLRSNHRPWRKGYNEYRIQYLNTAINDEAILETFKQGGALPAGYGFRLDARMVEIPWVLAHVANKNGPLLDAGSSLNYLSVLESPALVARDTTIITLAPEAKCFWKKGISYVFGDLCDLPFKDELFDIVVCISTIEHVGMNNSIYTSKDELTKPDTRRFLLAVGELNRVLKPNGVLYITFPFGRYENHGWFQQFDSDLLDTLCECFSPSKLSEAIFKYQPDGWILSDRGSCAHCEFFDVRQSRYFDSQSSIDYPSDYPAGERAIACLELFK